MYTVEVYNDLRVVVIASWGEGNNTVFQSLDPQEIVQFAMARAALCGYAIRCVA